jgi:hypothetical protein
LEPVKTAQKSLDASATISCMISLLFRIWQAIVRLGFKSDSQHVAIQARLQSLMDDWKAIEAQLAQIVEILVPGPAVGLVFTAYLDDGTSLDEVTKMDLRDDQKVSLTIQPVDKKGKPAPVDGVPEWASSDETVVTLEVAADGLSAVASAVAPGSCRVVVTADADLGSGVTSITGSIDFNITGGQATAVTVVAGTPEDQ